MFPGRPGPIPDVYKRQGETDADGFHRAVNVFFRMGCRDKARFVRGGREVDALFPVSYTHLAEDFRDSSLRILLVVRAGDAVAPPEAYGAAGGQTEVFFKMCIRDRAG